VISAKQVFTGVDYVRLACTDHSAFEQWASIVRPEYASEEMYGRKPHDRWILGYYGRVAEHAFLGKNQSGCMVQLSGPLAWERWHELELGRARCTRLDLQVTWPVAGDVGEYVREMYQVGQLHKTVGHRGASLQIVDTPEGAKMLTVGSRQSMLYGRLYDKYRESKEEAYKDCARWEIEVKSDAAVDLYAHLRANRGESGLVRAIVKDFWERRGMAPFWETYEGMEGRPPTKRTKTDETKLAWLATQVNPVLQKLAERGKLEEAIRALFPADLAESMISTLRAGESRDSQS